MGPPGFLSNERMGTTSHLGCQTGQVFCWLLIAARSCSVALRDIRSVFVLKIRTSERPRPPHQARLRFNRSQQVPTASAEQLPLSEASRAMNRPLSSLNRHGALGVGVAVGRHKIVRSHWKVRLDPTLLVSVVSLCLDQADAPLSGVPRRPHRPKPRMRSHKPAPASACAPGRFAGRSPSRSYRPGHRNAGRY